MKNHILSLTLLLLVYGCKETTTAVHKKTSNRDTSISIKNSFNPRFLDSTELETFLKSEKINDSLANRLREFYEKRNYQYAWLSDLGFAEYGQGFAEMLNNYVVYSKDSSIYDKELQSLLDSLSGDRYSAGSAKDKLKTELLLSKQFFRYAHRVYEGRNSIDQKDIDWFIPKRRIDLVMALDSLVSQKSSVFKVNEPLNPQYNLLKKQLLRYYSVQKELDSLKPLEITSKSIQDTVQNNNLKKRLYLLGDLSVASMEKNDRDSISAALKRFQSRHGLTVTGLTDRLTVTSLNQPVQSRIKQMLINMERFKWVPVQSSGDYILVNIPEFKLHIYEKGNYKLSMNVVVGSDANSTVIFMGILKYVVFSPYWNIPPSIVAKEILPGIRRNKNYLAQHNMERNGTSIREKPGPKNSLGQVKFLFPNSYNIYLHDTPVKSLFNDSKRAFSHGCIRVQEPAKLAGFILRNDTSWNQAKIAQAMNAGQEKYVTLKDTTPVFIIYFTSWVDRQGILNFRDDIYGHDKQMAAKLFVN